MNAFSKIDMAEVTRLTRAGKLGEAMALLQGRAAAQAEPGPKPAAKVRLISRAPATGETAAPRGPTPRSSLAPSWRDRLPNLRSMAGLKKKGADAAPVPEGARFEERTFSNAAGELSYKVYAPSGFRGQRLPVVVMLHGCTQNPDDFAVGTRMNTLAEEKGFLVAYPHQPASANMNKCWNWFNPGDQRRGAGEPSLIAGIALQVVEDFAADPTRVYVAGLSAGGAAAAILGSAYPDVFAAIGVHSGLACGAARDMRSAFAAMSGGGHLAPVVEQPVVPTIVFHGDADRTVNVVNGEQVITQARRAARLTETTTRGETPDGVSYTRTVQRDANGGDVLEQWVLHGGGHAWSGGDVNGSYADARGPNASRELIRFFLQHAKP